MPILATGTMSFSAASPPKCSRLLVIDVLVAMSAGGVLTYGSFCTGMTGGDNVDGVCPEPLYAILIAFSGACLLLRPIWLILNRVFQKRRCRNDRNLYSACRKWPCCGGCGGLFPLLCIFNLLLLIYANGIENAIVIGFTNGEPAEPLSTTFWGIQRDAWEAGQVRTLAWFRPHFPHFRFSCRLCCSLVPSCSLPSSQYYSFFLAITFNVAIPVAALLLMFTGWFSPYLRGTMVVTVVLIVKWAAFHQYSNLINSIGVPRPCAMHLCGGPAADRELCLPHCPRCLR